MGELLKEPTKKYPCAYCNSTNCTNRGHAEDCSEFQNNGEDFLERLEDKLDDELETDSREEDNPFAEDEY